MRLLLAVVGGVALAVLLGCGGSSGETGPGAYDPARLAAYRAALPSRAVLAAEPPGGAAASGPAPGTAAVGQTSAFVYFGIEVATSVNGAVGLVVDVLERIVDIPPNVYNSDTREFLWGPWESADPLDGYGYVLAYVRENPEGSAFRYTYGFARGLSADPSTYVPVLWGGSNPDPVHADLGEGAVAFDLEANYAFARQNPAFDASAPFDRGRFVAVFGRRLDAGAPGAVLTYDVTIFDHFQSRDRPGAPPLQADYFYGRYVLGWDDVTFLDFRVAGADLEPADGRPEDLDVRLATLNRGPGRAEVTARSQDAANGTFPAGSHGAVTECWNWELDTTFTASAIVPDPPSPAEFPSGAAATGCLPPFTSTLAALGIPTLDLVDPAILARMRDVAAHGLP